MSKGCAFCGGLFHLCSKHNCDRCGKFGCRNSLVIEEGDEWECVTCNDRENARERCKATVDMFGDDGNA